jgi:hypothetical protein
MEFLGTSTIDHDKHSGTIFHLLPSFNMIDKEDENTTLLDKYQRNSVFWWATPILEQRAWMQFRESQEADVLDFIQTLSNDPASRGKAWEAEIHHLIQCVGIQGTLRNLETGEVIKDYAISRSSGALFQNFEDINRTADYWRPVSPIHKTCDSYKPSDGLMFQMTVGKTHPINISGLENVVQSQVFRSFQKEHPETPLRMIFIVHPSVFKNFKKQSYTYKSKEKEQEGNSKTTSKNRKRNTTKRKAEQKIAIETQVCQYVMEVDLEERLRSLRQKMGIKRPRSAKDSNKHGKRWKAS